MTKECPNDLSPKENKSFVPSASFVIRALSSLLLPNSFVIRISSFHQALPLSDVNDAVIVRARLTFQRTAYCATEKAAPDGDGSGDSDRSRSGCASAGVLELSAVRSRDVG